MGEVMSVSIGNSYSPPQPGQPSTHTSLAGDPIGGAQKRLDELRKLEVRLKTGW